MSNYTILTNTWTAERTADEAGSTVTLECADLQDGHGRLFTDGAYRVKVDGKAVKGKGGTHPFKGESAWSDGERLFDDTVFALRRSGW